MRKALTDNQIHEAATLVGMGLSYWEAIKFMRLTCSVATVCRWVSAARLEALGETKSEVRRATIEGERVGDELYNLAWS